MDQAKHASREPESPGETLTQFSQDSSMHALQYIGDTKSLRWRRLLWVLILILLLCGFTYIGSIQLSVIWTRPTLSKLTSRFRDHLPSPAITICNLNPIKQSYVSKDPLVKTVMNGIYYEHNITVFTEMPDDVYQSINLTRYHDEGSVTVDETIQSCLFDENFKCEKYFEQIYTEFGACFMINTSSGAHADRFQSFILGPTGGFRILINVLSEEYFTSQYNRASGIKVIVHDPNETPIPTMSGFVLKPGTETFIGLNMKQTKYLPEPVQAFEDSYCLDTNADDFVSPLLTNGPYYVRACQYECLMESMSDFCGCSMFGYRGSYPECDVIGEIDCSLLVAMYQNRSTGDAKSECDCPGRCESTEYRLSISSADIANVELVKYLNTEYPTNANYAWLNVTLLRENYIWLYVYYDSFVVEVLQQVEVYTIGDIFATIGGHLGLFLGASLATLVELLEVAIMLLLACCRKLKPVSNVDAIKNN